MGSALILASGDSGDEVRTEIDGQPAIRHVVDALPSAVEDLVVCCDHHQREAIEEALAGIDYRLAVEPDPAGGPIAALRTGFRMTNSSTVAVIDCDGRGVDGALLEALFDTVDTAAVPRIGSQLYPLHAVYDRYAGRRAAERTLATGSNRLYDLLAEIDPVVVDAEAVTEGSTGLRTRDSRADGATVIGDPGT